MKKQIVFKCDEAFRRKLRTDKLRKENKLKTILTWEEYFNMLFYGEKKFPLINYKGGKK